MITPQDIQFDAEKHTYSFEGDSDYVSVTQLVKEFSRPFDSDKEAAKYAVKHRRSKSSVLDEWEREKLDAGRMGDIVHEYAESCIKDGIPASGTTRGEIVAGHGLQSEDYVERLRGCRKGVTAFLRKHLEIIIGDSYPELRICLPRLKLAGTIDLVCSYRGRRFILDWKTCKTIDQFSYGGKKMYAPLNKMWDSNFWHYTLQLNTYRLMLREVHGYEADGMAIVWLVNGGYHVWNVPDATVLVEKMIKRWHNRRLKKCQKAPATEQQTTKPSADTSTAS